jgi:hypothetical protein
MAAVTVAPIVNQDFKSKLRIEGKNAARCPVRKLFRHY